ncbi:MAG: hypothetical protein FWE32_06390 [Oscillospiraceae bacterium]|nr:hypothetical protein [Oscillospiraceae bacterium]
MESDTAAGSERGRGKAIAALILGIVAVLSVTLPVLPFYGSFCGVIGLFMASKAKKEGYRGGLRTAGLVISIIGTALAGLLLLVAAFFVAAFLGAMGLPLPLSNVKIPKTRSRPCWAGVVFLFTVRITCPLLGGTCYVRLQSRYL